MMTVKLGPRFQAENLRSIDDVMLALESLGHNLAATDLARLRNFNQAYLIITRNVRQQLKKGAFDDPEFLSRFDARFGYYYFNALQTYLQGKTAPHAWQSAFETVRNRHASPLICMALGINAHVNNDIPQVLIDTGAQLRHSKDYFLVNQIIERSIYEVIDSLEVSNSRLNPQRRLLKPLYKLSMKFLIRIWRYNSWQKHWRLRHGKTIVPDIEQSAKRTATSINRLPI